MKINSNKSCFWIVGTEEREKFREGLTVTKVVFESNFINWPDSSFSWLTVTKVVFEYNPAIDVELPKIRLTVTKVVFEY